MLRTTSVLGIPDGPRLIVIASNFGQRQHPAWYHNIRANPQVSVSVDGSDRMYRARELTGKNRDEQFQQAVRMNPGWLRYRTWAGERRIPVIELNPVPAPAVPSPASPT